MKQRGFFNVDRGDFEDPLFKPVGAFTSMEAWRWLQEAALYKAQPVPVASGRHRHMVQLKPGQLSFSIRFLAQKWSWSARGVQRFVAALVAGCRVTAQTGEGQTVLTLCNFDKNQHYDLEEEAATTQTATQTATQTHDLTNCNNSENRDGIFPVTTQPPRKPPQRRIKGTSNNDVL